MPFHFFHVGFHGVLISVMNLFQMRVYIRVLNWSIRVFEFPIEINGNKKKNKDYRSYSTLSYFEIENSSFSFIYFGTTKPLTECRLNFQNNFCGEGFRQY